MIKNILILCFALTFTKADVTPIFLISDEQGIWKTGSNIEDLTLILQAGNVTAFDYHYVKNLLFYNDAANEIIYSRQLLGNSSHSKLIISQPVKWSPISMAVDFLSDKLYVLDSHSQKVDVFDLDGRNHAIVVGFGLYYPTRLALDPYTGLMFINDNTRIIRYNMDGSSRTVLKNDNSVASSPGSFELHADRNVKRIYWVNLTSNAIVGSDYDGEFNAVHLIDEDLFSSKFHRYQYYHLIPPKTEISILHSEKYFYLLFNNTLKVISIERNNEILNKNLSALKYTTLIKFFNKSEQRMEKSPCNDNNVDCQEFCTLRNSELMNIGKSCGCKLTHKLSSDGRRCETIDDFIVFPYNYYIKSYILDRESKTFNQAMNVIAPRGERWYEFTGLSCDARDNKVYFATKGDKCMHRTRVNDTFQETLFCGIDNIRDLTFDWITKNIYYTEYDWHSNGRLRVVNPKNPSKVKTILKNLYRPNKVVVNPNKGYIFFMQNVPGKTTLKRVNLDGSNLIEFIDDQISKIEHLAIDFESDQLYWTDTGKNEGVKHMDFDGKNIKQIHTVHTRYPMFIDVYKKYLFLRTAYVDYQGFYRLDKLTGELSKDYRSEIEDSGYGFRVCSRDAQKLTSTNPCLLNNGGCREFCFAVPNSNNDTGMLINLEKICGCSDESILDYDGINCIKPF